MSGGRVAIILAAGRSSRFGADKLMARIDGMPLLHHAWAAAWDAPVERIIIVHRPELAGLCKAFATPRAGRVSIASDAQSDSLKAGLAAAGDVAGAFIFLGDMPRVPHDVAGRLLAGLGDHLAAMPVHDGRPGHPVLLSREGMVLAAQATGDRGAGAILKAHAGRVLMLPVDDPGVVLDIDTPEDLATVPAWTQARQA